VALPRPQLWRVTDRTTFDAIRRAGQRARRGPLTVTWLPPTPGVAAEPPRVAFALGRSIGGAVVRNRIRRRLRAGLRELQAAHDLPDGAYLLSGSPELARLPWAALCAVLRDAVHAATAGGVAP
jgi:ribonuclease P protein component